MEPRGGLGYRCASWTPVRLERSAISCGNGVSADPVLIELLNELRGYPCGGTTGAGKTAPEHELAAVVVPLQLMAEAGVLSFLSTTTIFGTPLDVTLSELALESFFPADAGTAERLRAMDARSRAQGP